MKHRSLNFVNTFTIMLQNTPIILLHYNWHIHNTMYLERDLRFFAEQPNVKKIHVYLDFRSSTYTLYTADYLRQIFRIMDKVRYKFKVKIIFHYNEYQNLTFSNDKYCADKNGYKMAIDKHLKKMYPDIIVLNSRIVTHSDNNYKLTILYYPYKYMDKYSSFGLYYTYGDVNRMINEDKKLYLNQFNPYKKSIEKEVIDLNDTRSNI